MPFRNAERHLPACLDALAAQAPFDGSYEIIAADDGSTDGSAEIVSGFDGVRLVRSEGHGAYAARNSALVDAEGDVFAFTDADCAAEPDWLRTLVAELEDPQAEVVVGARPPGGTSPALSLVAAYEQTKDEFIFGGENVNVYYGSTNNMAVRRKAFAAHGPFVERRRGADTIFVRSLVDALSCESVRYRPDARVRHLEIQRVADYYRKLFVYSRSMRRVRDDARVRPLRTGERLRVWRRTVRNRGVSQVEAAALLAVLTTGAIFWGLGRLSAPAPLPQA